MKGSNVQQEKSDYRQHEIPPIMIMKTRATGEPVVSKSEG